MSSMIAKSAAFEKTYKEYLSQIASIDFKSNAEKLGGQIDGDDVIIPFFGKPHRISPAGITDMLGKRPTLAISVVISKYLLLCPGTTPKENDWVSYRDFKDAAPFAGAFANNAEKGVAINFKIVEGKIRFEINSDVLDNLKLQVSSQLLKLAIFVKGKKKDG